MARTALGGALLRGHGALRRFLSSHPPPRPPAAGAAASSSRSSEDGESADDFEKRLFCNDDPNEGSFFQKLDRIEKAHPRFSNVGDKSSPEFMRGLSGNGNFEFMMAHGDSPDSDSLDDGMDVKLDEASFFSELEDMDESEITFRPDVEFHVGNTYTTRDLDLTKPGVQHEFPREEFQTTTEEVLRKADFRNVRFLSNFLTESGIIIKRSQTRISAKAQRKVAREIKTARALGLMPFTAMGTKPFVFGKSMEDGDEEYEEKGEATEPGDNVVRTI